MRSHFGSRPFLLEPLLLTRVWRFLFAFRQFCETRAMPRGWRQHDELSEAFWRRMLMGPRPPSVQWLPSPPEPESCCSSAQSSLAWSHRGPRTRSRQRGSPKNPQQCRGRLCRTNSEVGTSRRDSGQRQSTISRVDFSFEEVASCVHITNRRTIGCVSEIRGTSPKTTCSGRGSREEGCRDSVPSSRWNFKRGSTD